MFVVLRLSPQKLVALLHAVDIGCASYVLRGIELRVALEEVRVGAQAELEWVREHLWLQHALIVISELHLRVQLVENMIRSSFVKAFGEQAVGLVVLRVSWSTRLYIAAV